MKLLVAAVVVLLNVAIAESQLSSSKIPVQITDLKLAGPPFDLEAQVGSTQSDLQLLLLVRHLETKRFMLPRQQDGTPAVLEPQSGSPRNWRVRWWKPGMSSAQYYVFVCFTPKRLGWSRERENRSFQYLPFDEATSVEQVFKVLSEFGWNPAGYTFVTR